MGGARELVIGEKEGFSVLGTVSRRRSRLLRGFYVHFAEALLDLVAPTLRALLTVLLVLLKGLR